MPINQQANATWGKSDKENEQFLIKNYELLEQSENVY